MGNLLHSLWAKFPNCHADIPDKDLPEMRYLGGV